MAVEVTYLECPGGVDLLQVFHRSGGGAVLESALPVAWTFNLPAPDLCVR